MQCLNLATKLSKKLPILIIFLSWFRDGLCFGIHKKMVQQYLQQAYFLGNFMEAN